METITMSKKEIRYGEVISQIVAKKLSQSNAALLLGLSVRQIKRLCKRYKEEGLSGLAHRNRGRPSNNKINEDLKNSIFKIITTEYPDFSCQLISELLSERHGISVSAEWIRNLLAQTKVRIPKSRSGQKCHQPRTRRSRRGELIQIDGSYHNWFEGRGDKCCLLVAIDDATSELMGLKFITHESTVGYMELISEYMRKHGRPITFYSDRLNTLKTGSSQIDRALSELDIGLINANSPQAKGRVERANKTLQDRLIKLMRLAGISNMDDGNVFLQKYMEIHNKQFAREPRDKVDAHRELPKHKNINKIFCGKTKRKVSKSLSIQYQGKIYNLNCKKIKHRLVGKTALVMELSDKVHIEINGIEYDYKIHEDQPYKEAMNRKQMDAWIDKKKPSTVIQKRRKGISVNF